MGKTLKVLLVSDTHGMHGNLMEAVGREAPFDRVLHMGDAEGCDDEIREIAGSPLDIVAGNCDLPGSLPDEKMLSIGGVSVFITHGHEYYVNMGMGVLRDQAQACGCRVALFGHTHRPFLEESGGVILANPGSISFPRQPDRVPSYGILRIADGVPRVEIRYL